MKHWAIEYLVNPSGRRQRWRLDLRTIRRRRFDAKQAPLDLDQSPKFYDDYSARWRAGTARVVKVSIERCA